MNDEKIYFVAPIGNGSMNCSEISLASNVEIETAKSQQTLQSSAVQAHELANVLICENDINFTEEIVIKPETDLISDVFEENYNLILNNLNSASYVKLEEDFKQLSRKFKPEENVSDTSTKVKKEPMTEVSKHIQFCNLRWKITQVCSEQEKFPNLGNIFTPVNHVSIMEYSIIAEILIVQC